MTIQTHADDRKQMVNEISELLNTPAVYLRTPSYAYQIGNLTVNRDASISADNAADLEAIKPLLIEKGYIEAETITEPDTVEVAEEASPDTEPPTNEADDPEAEEESKGSETDQSQEISNLMVSFPVDNKPVSMLKNLILILYSKQTLLNRVNDCESLRISDATVERLMEANPQTYEDFVTLMQSLVASGDIIGLAFGDGNLRIDYGRIDHPEASMIYLHLTQKIHLFAENATRVFPKHEQPENEKYFMRSWLVRMGMGGPEYKGIRKHLLQNLKGHSAFRTEADAQKHRDKYAQIRKDMREAGDNHAE